jgi:hypothetical protein
MKGEPMKRVGWVCLVGILLAAGAAWGQDDAVQTRSTIGFVFAADDLRIIGAEEAATGVLSFGTVVEIDGEVRGDVAMIGGRLTVRGTVTDDIFAVGIDVDVLAGATVLGDVWVLGGDVEVAAGASIAGRVRDSSYWEKQIERGWDEGEGAWRFAAVQSAGAFFLNALALIVFGYLLLHFLRRPVTGIARGISRRFWASLGIGFAAVIVLVPLAVLLLVTGFGLPWILPLFAIYALASYLGILGTALIGEMALARVFRRPETQGGALFALAAVILSGLRAIPWFGMLLSLVLALVGIGVCTMTRFGRTESGAEA